MEQTKSRSTIYLIALLSLFVIISGYFWNKSRNLNNTIQELTQHNEQLASEVSSLQTLRTDLLDDIDLLQSQYDDMINANDSLQTLFEKATKDVAARKLEIKNIKKSFASDAAGMQAEIEQLRTIKKEMAALVAQIQTENETLKESNQALVAAVATVEAENKDMEFQISNLHSTTTKLEKENKNFMAESARATNFLVNLQKRGDKTTTNAKRIREIEVSFDLSNVPNSIKGEQNVYVVITNENGIPVKVANPINATISTSGKKQEIVAQQVMKINMSDSDRQQLKINPESGSLKEGNYRVSVYADWGLLGGAEFKLK